MFPVTGNWLFWLNGKCECVNTVQRYENEDDLCCMNIKRIFIKTQLYELHFTYSDVSTYWVKYEWMKCL